MYGPRALALAGAKADGWVPSLGQGRQPLGEMADRFDQAATDAGRDPGDIRRVLNIWGEITDGTSGGSFHGPAGQWVDGLASLVLDLGFDTFVSAATIPT